MEVVLNEVKSITPLDILEQQHSIDSINWIESGAPIYRIKKPDVPNKHLVSYSVLIDPIAREILLVEHKNAQLWLPCGGHVEPNEHPQISAKREIEEELGQEFNLLFEKPLFITQAETVGLTAGHTDVSLWYVFSGTKNSKFDFDEEELHSVKWFPFDEVPLDKSDPHIGRFLEKIKRSIP